jgi:hypothetical protein
MKRILPGDLFFMTELGASPWYTCVTIVHTENKNGIPISIGTLLTADSVRLIPFRFRSAKEVCVPPGMGRKWEKWDVVPYAPET